MVCNMLIGYSSVTMVDEHSWVLMWRSISSIDAGMILGKVGCPRFLIDGNLNVVPDDGFNAGVFQHPHTDGAWTDVFDGLPGNGVFIGFVIDFVDEIESHHVERGADHVFSGCGDDTVLFGMDGLAVVVVV